MMLDRLYLECFSGISGDMLVGALLDLGASFEGLKEELRKLPVSGYVLEFGYEQKCGIRSGAFRVRLEDEEMADVHGGYKGHYKESADKGCEENQEKYVQECCVRQHGESVQHGEYEHHSEGHEHSYEHHSEGHEYSHEHHSEEHEHSHEHHSEGHQHLHSHEHRSYRDIRNLIEGTELKPEVKESALRIFRVLAEAEAKVHGRAVEEVAFHEVGAIDSIVDIVGAAICLDDLGIREILVSPMYEGQGHTWCQHGRIPVPVPAVLELAVTHGLPLRITDVKGEMITPTGAAVVAALANLEGSPANYRICKVGIGCGEKEFPHANILRAMLMEPLKDNAAQEQKEQVWVLETNVDDSTGEQIGYAIERLLGAGAKDACALPLYMKKHRPAYLLQVICDEAKVQEMEAVLFQETSSIGLRKYEAERTVLERRMEELDTPYGKIRVKCCKHGSAQYCYPEYECLKKIAAEKKLPYQEVYREVLRSIENRG